MVGKAIACNVRWKNTATGLKSTILALLESEFRKRDGRSRRPERGAGEVEGATDSAEGADRGKAKFEIWKRSYKAT